MKTYSETQGEPPFNWNLFLKNARKGRVTEAQKEDAIRRSSNWITCACGNQCDAIPRVLDKPIDGVLARLGQFFYGHVAAERWDAATETLVKIEKRSSEILFEIGIK
jgi:hypothetical protein